MATVIVVVVMVFVVLGILAKSVESIKKSGQKMKGKNRCQACGSRLKAVRGMYMPVCPKCGTRQSWAA